MKAHRLAYELFVGTIGRLQVLHKCDNPPCVRPDHLFLGTQADNNRDMFTKGRARPGRHIGSCHPRALLNEQSAAAIKVMLAQGRRHREIAALYGVSRPTVTAIAAGRLWAHV